MTLDNAHIHQFRKDEEKRLSELFHRLDVNGDGRIDVTDLTKSLKRFQVPQIPGQAQKIIDKYDRDKDGHMDFKDFVEYVFEHEKQLKLSFAEVDKNNDGFIDSQEIKDAFEKLGVPIDYVEAERLLHRMDKDKTLLINWNEWREFLFLHPQPSIQVILHDWRHASIIDVGEDTLVPDDFTESEIRSGMWWRHLAAGAAAGAVSRTCTAPLDRLKVILQVHATSQNNLGIITGFRGMLNEGGCKSLWRGNGVNIIKIAPESALKFMAYEQIKRIIRNDTNRDLYIWERFCAGSLAGAISQTVIYPMEVVKTRLALRKTGQYTGVKDCMCKIYQGEGTRSFYRGYIPNIVGIIPYAGIDLAIYETLKRLYISRHSNGEDPGVLILLACGTASSTCGQLASYPLALVRTKLQAKARLTSSDTMTGLIRTIYQNEGFTGLYRGITPNFMKVAPAVSISYVVYEHVRKFLGVQMT